MAVMSSSTGWMGNEVFHKFRQAELEGRVSGKIKPYCKNGKVWFPTMKRAKIVFPALMVVAGQFLFLGGSVGIR